MCQDWLSPGWGAVCDSAQGLRSDDAKMPLTNAVRLPWRPPYPLPPHSPNPTTHALQEFIRVGYYVNNEYLEEELRDNPPEVPLIDRQALAPRGPRGRGLPFGRLHCPSPGGGRGSGRVGWLALGPKSWLPQRASSGKGGRGAARRRATLRQPGRCPTLLHAPAAVPRRQPRTHDHPRAPAPRAQPRAPPPRAPPPKQTHTHTQ